MKKLHLILTAFFLLLVLDSCREPVVIEPDPVYGCTDPSSPYYNPDATIDDGSCEGSAPGCTDPNAINYNPLATENDGSCIYAGPMVPLKNGSVWILNDVLNLPILGEADWTLWISIIGDTTINGEDYKIFEEVEGNPGLREDMDTTLYAMRRDLKGNYYRYELDGSNLASDFINYPLSQGKEWYDTEDERHYKGLVNSVGELTTPAGTFEDVAEVRYIQLWDAEDKTVWMKENHGFLRVKRQADSGILGITFDVDMELTFYNIP